MIESINHISQIWWSWTTGMLWQVGVLILIVGCLDLLVRRWAWPHVRYALWLMVLVKLMMPPGIHLSSSLTAHVQPQVSYWVYPEAEESNMGGGEATFSTIEPVVQPMSQLEYIPAVQSDTAPLSLTEAVPWRPRLTWHAWAMLVWLLGIGALASWLIWRLEHLRLEDPDLAEEARLPESFYQMADTCAERIGLASCPKIIITNKILVPAVTGIVRPVLLMPVGFLAKLDRKDTEHMLLHEFAHIKRGDLVVHGVYMVLQIMYWYNPLLWLVSRQMHHLRELCCDATVALHLRERALEYRQTLLEVARQYLARSVEPGLGLLGLFEDSNRLAVRLNWLKKQTWRYRRTRLVLVSVLVLAMILCVLPMAQANEKPEVNDPNQAVVVSTDEASSETNPEAVVEAVVVPEVPVPPVAEMSVPKVPEVIVPKPKPEPTPAIVKPIKPKPVIDRKQKTPTLVKEVTYQASQEEFVTLQVQNPRGKIQVRGDQDSKEVKVLIKTTAKNQELAKALADQVEIKGKQKGHQFSVQARPLDNQGWDKMNVDLEINVPRGVDLELESEFGAIAVQDIQGGVTAHNKMGAIQLSGVNGCMELESQVGSIQVVLPKETSAKIEAEVKAGLLKTDLDIPVKRKDWGAYLYGKLGSGDHNIKIKSQAGAVAIQSEVAQASVSTCSESTGHGCSEHKEHECTSVAKVSCGTVSVASSSETEAAKQAVDQSVLKVTSLKDYPKSNGHVIERKESHVLPLVAEKQLKIINPDGDVTIRGENRANGQLEATFYLKAPGKPCAQRLSKQVSLQVIKQDNGLIVQPELPKKLQKGYAVSVDLILTVPSKTYLDLDLEDGDVTVQNLGAPVKLVHEDGDVILKNIGGGLNINLEDGDVDLANIGGAVTMDHEDGDITCKNIGGSVNVNHEDGSIRLYQIGGSVKAELEDGDIVCKNISGQVDIQHDDGTVDFENISGKIKVNGR